VSEYVRPVNIETWRAMFGPQHSLLAAKSCLLEKFGRCSDSIGVNISSSTTLVDLSALGPGPDQISAPNNPVNPVNQFLRSPDSDRLP
jgi:hypothetical protein